MRQIEWEREMTPDDFAVARTGSARKCARSLGRLHDLRWSTGTRLVAPGLLDQQSLLGDRIDSLPRRGREFSARPSLAAVGVSAVLLALLLGEGLIPSWVAIAQTKGSESAVFLQTGVGGTPLHRYEVSSVRIDKTGDITRSVHFRQTPDALYIENFTLRLLIRQAYGVADYQIQGAPKWVNSEEFEIEAKMEESAAEELLKLGVNERLLQRRLMLQALLADRFKLRVRRETKQGPVYALVVAKKGPKLRESKPDHFAGGHNEKGITIGGGRLTCYDAPLGPLIRQLSQQLNRPVLDKTGLTGEYDFTLPWTPEEFQVSVFKYAEGNELPSEGISSAEPAGPSIFTAIEEQLGLKLKTAKGPVEVLVVDHVEPPTPN
jgi:uncharacterized protein (TIGR03435 family)